MAKKRTPNYLSILDDPWTDDDVASHASFLEEERKRPAPRPDFSNVEAGSGTTETPPVEQSMLDRYMALQGSAQQAGLGGLQRLGSLGFATANGSFPLPAGVNSAIQNLVPESVRDEAKKFYGGLVQSGSQQAQISEQLRNVADLPGPVDTLARGVTDTIGSPSSLASIPGGPFAAIPAADVYAQEYVAGIQGGLTPKEAEGRASAMAALEGGVSAIPAGKYLDKLTGGTGSRALKRFLAGRTKNVIGGVVRTAAGEGAEEATTEAAQAGVDNLLASQGVNQRVQDFSSTQAPKTPNELWERVKRAGVAGAVGGVGMGTPHVLLEDAHQAGKLAADLNKKYDPYLDIADSETKRKAAGPKPRIRVPAESTVAAPIVKPTPTEERTAAEEIDQDFLNGLRSEQRATGKGGANARSIIQNITTNINSSEARTLATRLNRGDVVLVERDTHIPNAEARGSAGYYDGKRTYIVADKIDPAKPLLGQVMDVLAHETVHAGDVSGSIDNKLVGQKNNAKLNNLIRTTAERQAAQMGLTLDQVAGLDSNSELFSNLTPEQKAYNFASRFTTSEGAKNMEMVAYYTNFARDAASQRGARKATANVWQNVKSAVRDTFGVDAKLDDVAYLSEKLLSDAAATDKPLTGDVPATVEKFGGGTDTGLQMIGGPEATGFNQAKEEGRTYTGKADLKERFEFSDAQSSVAADDFAIQDIVDGRAAKLKDVLKHDEFFKQYPDLGNMISVVADKSLNDSQYGYFDSRTLRIGVNPNVLTGNKQRLRKLLLHEVQHVVQATEGFVRGTSPDALRNPEVAQTLAKEGGRLESVPANFEIGLALRNMEPGDRTEWNKLVANVEDESGPLTIEETAALFLDEGYGDRSKNQLIRGQQNMYNRARLTFKAAVEDTQIDKARAFDLYQRDYGETEARNTEFRADMADKMRKVFPPEQTMQFAEGAVPAERTLDSRAYTRGLKAEGLAMSEEAVGFDRGNIPTNDTVGKGKVARAVERLLVPGGYKDNQLEEMIRHAASLPASMAQRGTYLNNKFREAVDANVSKSNGKYTDESFRTMLSQRIDTVDKLETIEQREAAINAIDREFPGIGAALNELRQYKLSLTRELLSLRKKDPKKLSEKERNIYKKMVHNAERYTTRAYLATYDKEIGDSYGKTMLKQFGKDPGSKEGKIVKTALDYLVKNELTVPDKTTLENMTTDKLRRMHQAWVGPTEGFKDTAGKNQMIQNLVNMPTKTKQEIDKKAWEVVQEMLGQTEEKSGMAREFTPSMRQNRTILEARTDMPWQLRNLLGEITDPLLREAISLNRMINLTTKTRFLTESYEKGKGKWWSDTKDGQFQIKVDGSGYGPLDGKFVNQDMADAITGTVMNLRGMDEALSEVAQNGDLLMKVLAGKAFPLMKQIMSAQKTYGVVFDIYNGLVNLVGAVAFMGPMNGLVPLGSTSMKGMNGAAKTLLLDIWDRKVSKANSELVEELLMAGVTDSATMGEFKGHAYDDIKKELQKLGGQNLTPGKVFSSVFKFAMGQHKLGEAARTAYAFMDVWVKVATYYDRKDFNTKMNRLEGWGLSDEDIIRKSGFEASGTNISYERGIPLAKTLEKNIPLFMFLTYKIEVVRASVVSIKRGLDDLMASAKAKTPEGKRLAAAQGIKRLVGTTAVLSTIIGGTLHVLSAEDDDEKKKRFLDFSWMQNQIMYRLGKDKDGNEVMWNISRLDPLGPMNELITSIGHAPEGQYTETAVKALGDYFFAESKGVLAVYQLMHDATVAGLASALGNEGIREWDMDMQRKGIVERNYPEFYKQLQKLPGNIGENSAEVIERLFLPAQVRPWIDERGKTDSQVGEVFRMLGMSMYVRDPDKSFTGKAIEHDKTVDALKKQRDEAAKAGNLDPDKLKDLIEREYESFQGLSNGYQGYLAFDKTTAAGAADIIGNKKLAAQVRTGRFKSQVADVKALDNWRKKELKKKGANRQAIQEQYRELRKLYSEVD